MICLDYTVCFFLYPIIHSMSSSKRKTSDSQAILIVTQTISTILQDEIKKKMEFPPHKETMNLTFTHFRPFYTSKTRLGGCH